jgi:LacI family transcriptional regulator
MEAYGRRKATINQVANLAGVSVTTVSLYLRGKPGVCSKRTARRIDDAVQALNYQPNPLAGTSYNKVRHTVGLLAANDLERGKKPSAVYNMRHIHGILEVANELDYSILSYPYRVFTERHHRSVLDGRVDAVLFYGGANHQIVDDLVSAGMPVVCFGSPDVDDRVAGWVHLDEAEVSRLAVDHLWSLGHRRIAHLAGPYEDCFRYPNGIQDRADRVLERAEPVSWARLNALTEIMKERRSFDPELVSGANAWKYPDARAAIERWWQSPNPPTAVYAANDYLAWEVVQWAREQRIQIPRQLAIVGVDNVEGPDRELFLTSIDIDVEEIGRLAMHAVLDVLAGADAQATHQCVQPIGISVRGSSVELHSGLQVLGQTPRTRKL